MQREKLYLNMARYEEEINKHRGEYHPDVRIDGRKARLWVQTDLAPIMGITPQHLSGIKSGHEPTSEKALMKLADAWGVNWKWLCGLSDSRTEKEEMKNQFLSRINDSYRKTFSVLAYMESLGFVFSTHERGFIRTMTCRYQEADSQEAKTITLSPEQFDAVLHAMNQAASTALLSCFELLNAKTIEEPEPEEEREREETTEEAIDDYYMRGRNDIERMFEVLIKRADNEEEPPTS